MLVDEWSRWGSGIPIGSCHKDRGVICVLMASNWDFLAHVRDEDEDDAGVG